MEAVAAFGVAGNVIQFVQFASTLLSTAATIYQSASGSTLEADAMEKIYGTLLQFSRDLETGDRDCGIRHSKHEDALVELAAACEEKCQELLRLVGDLKVTPGRKQKLWKSVHAALRTICPPARIEKLQQDIDALQKSMTLLLCAISSDNTGTSKLLLQEMQKGAALSHGVLLDQLKKLQTSAENPQHGHQGTNSETPEPTTLVRELERLVIQIRGVLSGPTTKMKEQAVLKSLDYDCRQLRHEQIKPAHEATFSWIYTTSSDTEAKRHRFLDWLETGDGFFWISGKAGAGKSTLMKFITSDDNEHTKAALQTWADPCKAIVASHYFWSSGKELQRSYGGLWRSLLFDMFSQVPEMISVVCHEESWWSSSVADDLGHSTISPKWTVASLTRCLQRLASLDSLPIEVKFCLFIDGLDEYDEDAEDHFDMSQTLLELTTSPHLKICFSSRPWNVFRDCFGGDPPRTLQVHELTADDIECYARDKLRGLPWASYASSLTRKDSTKSAHDPRQYLVNQFAKQVRIQSEGVFLWVFLVVRLLRSGLTNRDSLQELEQRLLSFPSDLEAFFWRIIRGIDPFYHQTMAEYFGLMIRFHSMHVMDYAMYDIGYNGREPLPPRVLCRWSESEYHERQDAITRRVCAVTGGLLEVGQLYHTMLGGQVNFLHRSVRDFLAKDTVRDFLAGKIREDSTPLASRLEYFLGICEYLPLAHLVGLTNEAKLEITPFIEAMRLGVRYASAADHSNYEKTKALLDRLEGSLLEIASFCDGHLDDGLDSFPYCCEDSLTDVLSPLFGSSEGETLAKGRPGDVLSNVFRAFILGGDLRKYLASKLNENPEYFCGFPMSPLKFAAGRFPFDSSFRHWPGPQFKALLEHGFNPNDSAYPSGEIHEHERTPWQTLMYVLCGENTYRIYALVPAIASGLLNLFLSYGADPNAMTQRLGGQRGEIASWVVVILALMEEPDLNELMGDEVYDELLRYLFGGGIEVRLLIADPKPVSGEHCCSAWEDLKALLECLNRGHHRIDGSKATRAYLERTSRLLFELAKTGTAAQDLVLPWEEIEPLLRNIYPPQYLQPLLDITGADPQASSDFGTTESNPNVRVTGVQSARCPACEVFLAECPSYAEFKWVRVADATRDFGTDKVSIEDLLEFECTADKMRHQLLHGAGRN